MSDGDYRLDFDRQTRIGLPEAVFCHPKSADQIAEALRIADKAGQSLLLTRLSPEKADALSAASRHEIDYDAVSQTAFFGSPQTAGDAPAVAVVCAGTSDIPVAQEAQRTLEFLGYSAKPFFDVGVAGLWRIEEVRDELATFPVVIVAAGMDAALVSVVGGLVAGVVIAVPTATGYGVAADGQSALNASLASCAPGVVVTNIGNGYGAACAAIRVLLAAGRGK